MQCGVQRKLSDPEKRKEGARCEQKACRIRLRRRPRLAGTLWWHLGRGGTTWHIIARHGTGGGVSMAQCWLTNLGANGAGKVLGLEAPGDLQW